MKVGRLFLIVVALFFVLFNCRNAMAQQASLTIRLGTFISVGWIPDQVYFSSGDARVIAVDSLAVMALGPFEMLVISAGSDIRMGAGREGAGNKNLIFGNSSAIPCDRGVNVLNGQQQITLPLQSRVNTFVSITAL
ncbi:MAG: hypothetical protein ACN6PN_02215 [Sphingobacterium sp.]